MSIGQGIPALDVSFVSIGVLFEGSGAFLKVQGGRMSRHSQA